MDLKHSLTRLRESSTRLERHQHHLPSELRPFVELVHAQTAVLEAFIEFEKKVKLNKRQCCRSKDRKDRRAPTGLEQESLPTTLVAPGRKLLETIQTNENDQQQEEIWSMMAESRETEARHPNRSSQNVLSAFQTASTVQKPIDDALLPRLQATVYKAEPPKAGKKSQPFRQRPKHLAQLVQSSNRVISEQHMSLPTPVIPGTFPLTPRLPPDPSSTLSASMRNSLELSVITSNHAPVKDASFPLVDQPAHLQTNVALKSSSELSLADTADEICEAHLQEALGNLITSMKERKKVPVGRLKGSFALYSTDFRKCLAQHPGSVPDYEQRLSVFTSASNWSAHLPDIIPPSSTQLAMELHIYPACHLLVLPFTPPKNAGLKWHSLEAIDLHQERDLCMLEVMYPGDGFIKLKVRLSQVLGETSSAKDEQPDRFIEFSGIWQNTKSRDGVHYIKDFPPRHKQNAGKARLIGSNDTVKLGDGPKGPNQEKFRSSVGARPLPKLRTGRFSEEQRPRSSNALDIRKYSEANPLYADSSQDMSAIPASKGSARPPTDAAVDTEPANTLTLTMSSTPPSSAKLTRRDPSASPSRRGREDTLALRRSGGIRRASTPKRSRSQESDLLPANDIWSPVSPP